MECEVISNLIRTIQSKREEFVKQNGILPNMIIMDRGNQVLLNMHYVNEIGTDMNTIYGMKVLVDNSIIRPEDFKVYYFDELERQDMKEIDYRKIRYNIKQIFDMLDKINEK